MAQTRTDSTYKNTTDPNLVKILDFGMHPYADTFIGAHQLHLSEPVLPLQCYLDKNTGLIQLGYISDSTERYNLYPYSYTSSNSKFSRDHWDTFASIMKRVFHLKGKTIVEIGSNDGYLAKQFLGDDNVVLGIDHSDEMCELARKNGIATLAIPFTSKDVSMIGKTDLIIANNVLNHANDVRDFLKGVRRMLKKSGSFVFEVPYWKSTVLSNKFDQIYHEHISYFTVKSVRNLLTEAGLHITNIQEIDYHGGSLRVFANRYTDVSDTETNWKDIQEEEDRGLFDVEFYEKWQTSLNMDRSQFLTRFYRTKLFNPGAKIIAVGAAAKANTFLNYYGLNSTIIDYITDSSEHKQGKFTPLTRIPIVPDEIFAGLDDVFAMILSWNIAGPIKKSLLKINPKIKFISL